MAQRLTALVDRIIALRPRTHIVLSAVAPIRMPSFQLASEDYASWVKSVVAQERARGHGVVLADIYDAFFRKTAGRRQPIPGLIDYKGVHPTAIGYQVMANVYTKAVQAALGG
jgi:lysophospholipase L1-like esterase